MLHIHCVHAKQATPFRGLTLALFCLFFACKLAAQTDAICDKSPYVFEGTPQATLCDQYGGQIYSLQIGAGTPYLNSSQLPATLPANIEIVGDFNINSNPIEFVNVTMKISPGVAIRLTGSDKALWLNNCRLFCCNGLWKGIEIQGQNHAVRVFGGSHIEDAQTVIYSAQQKGTLIDINGATFNRNGVGVSLEGAPGWTAAEEPRITRLRNAVFTVTAPLNQNAVPIAGIISKNVTRPLNPSQASNDNNTFQGLLYGIWAEGSLTRLHVFNHDYLNNVSYGIYFLGGSLLDVRAGSFFSNNRFGILSYNAKDLNCIGNAFVISQNSSADRALVRVQQPKVGHLLTVQNCSFSISGYNLSAFVTGLDIRANPALPTRLRVYTDTFNLSNTIGMQSTGLKVRGNIIAGSDLDIQFTNLFRVGTGTSQQNIGFELSGGIYRNGLRFRNNHFYCYGTGIKLAGSVIGNDNEISGNEFFPLLGTDFLLGQGMDIQAFEGLKVCGNLVRPRALRGSYLFRGQSMGTLFTSNSTWPSNFLIETGATIGQQIDRNNTWRPSINLDNTVSARPLVKNANNDQQIVTASKFVVNESQSVYNSSTNTYAYLSLLHPDRVEPDVFPLEDAFFDDGGSAQSSDCSFAWGAADFGDVAIAQGNFGAWFPTTPAVGWDAKQYLYRKLNLYPAYVNAHGAFAPFLSAQANTSVGKFFDLEQLVQEAFTMPPGLKAQFDGLEADIASLEAGIANAVSPSTALSLSQQQKAKLNNLEVVKSQFAAYTATKLGQAQNLLPGIAPAQAHEQHKKRVYEIFLVSQLTQGGTFTPAQVAELKSIGQQCTEVGGKAVFFARGLLGDCDYAAIRDAVEACTPPPAEARAETAQAPPLEIALWPNPANESVWLDMPAEGTLGIWGTDGRLLRQLTLAQGRQQVPLGLTAGLYLFRIQLSDGRVCAQKIAVARQ